MGAQKCPPHLQVCQSEAGGFRVFVFRLDPRSSVRNQLGANFGDFVGRQVLGKVPEENKSIFNKQFFPFATSVKVLNLKVEL